MVWFFISNKGRKMRTPESRMREERKKYIEDEVEQLLLEKSLDELNELREKGGDEVGSIKWKEHFNGRDLYHSIDFFVKVKDIEGEISRRMALDSYFQNICEAETKMGEDYWLEKYGGVVETKAEYNLYDQWR